ncbi:hypothetical protein [Paenisporosarcina cavernae]|uniref:Uncharacterized protein n=1 Tax=Paenisporosarcina cavernae TaxID=2320858 RepID=A0A385YVS1_9BACL|nr:hypothetical protein [Paenisporosarcina cavernae]AYC29603.1 hypothetical protein D3873_06780 [Paenisporosarcina cavernae]
MNEQKKRIILNEISFWKSNHLLPEHYCDFLHALYSEGDSENSENQDAITHSVLAKEKMKKTRNLIFLVFVAMAIVGSLFLPFLAPAISIVIGAVFIFSCIYYIWKKGASAKNFFIPISYIVGAFVLLGISLKVWTSYFPEYPLLLILLLIGNCFSWIFIGVKLKLHYFTLSGSLALVLIILYRIILT